MVTVREVPAAAGASTSTVSYVVTGDKRLPAATIPKVQASIRELGCSPNVAGRALFLNVALIEPRSRRAAARGIPIPDDLSIVVLASGEQPEVGRLPSLSGEG